ncbi:serine hydrolase [Ramlibacter sp. WS9]|uniref:serine hydrolase domain-containing protein n=1 Tax=Ramlibacter sp. WS9 TaxID=1882741 RepID=UPI0011438F3D|nr:serine hydrolase domain-containing protein [Ramlibacter sp. WS9]ROZ78115.1 class A beta-lactamase-related serine hydrolase [Ramlibacter sp. WS9]HSV36705.1 serine hydrolase domain-containing protein [Ramlibacter sp.]
MSNLDERLRAVVRHAGIPGVVCAAASQAELIDVTALGQVEFGSAQAMTLDTTFWIASITKLATAVAVLQLVERRSLGLNDEVADYLPFFEDPEVLASFGRTPARARVRVRHLLTHTAGFGYEAWSPTLSEYVAQNGLPAARTGSRRSLERPLLFQPGACWNYGIGMDWAGLLVEQVSCGTLSDYLEANVFKPLGMRSTGFAPVPAVIRAVLHTRQADRVLDRTPMDPNPYREFDSGGAGLYSTPRDVLRLLQSILRADRGSTSEVLLPETVAQARCNQIDLLSVRDLPTCIPERSHDLALFPGRKKKWSYLGLLHQEAEPAGRSAGSVSWAGVANTFFWIDFDMSVAAVVFAQALPFLDPDVLAIVERYEQGLYGRLRRQATA